ncbi:pyridoxamine 5'-phosphate oxidase family protein [Paraburkholderia mimosarum]|uniref:2Fe-2S iron-sulfur cluster-binding protein n=1 Tax=Paraburkholderia mimosarum TaxID=312026 RepID=UPI0039C45496
MSKPALPPSPGWDLERSPFHRGELEIQERVGVREKIGKQGRQAVRRYLTPQHREFFPMLPYVFVGSVDVHGRPWASVLVGEPGFINPTNEVSVSVRARPLYGDPLNESLAPGSDVALLGVQFHTRRRNRIIGTVTAMTPDGFTVDVRQTLGICPQYIQGREITFDRDPLVPEARPVHRGTALDGAARKIIEKADTYFVASVAPRSEDEIAMGVKISHRGGRPGFVNIDDDRTLNAPDFLGNFIFNTLGNWLIDNHAGLMFIDFDNGSVLYIAAHAEVIWEGPELRAFTGAQRLFRYHIDEVIRVEASLPCHFTAPDYSPLLARTGHWDEVTQTLEAERLRTVWRPFTVTDIVDESTVIRSFVLAPADGRGLATYRPGQYLPIRLQPEGWAEPTTRTYTLSDASNGRTYRISVKREGKGGVSDWLHDHVGIGDTIETLTPRGTFVFDEAAGRPVVLISAGVGITPMVAMLNSQLVNDGRTLLHKPIRFIHACIDSQRRAFAAHLARKAELHANLTLHIVFSRPSADDVLGKTHHSVGHIDRALLQRLLPLDDYDFYLCGPATFMQSLYDAILSFGVRDKRIHLESFGPASVSRRVEHTAEVDTSEGVVVEFAKSGKTAIWRPKCGSLLELAEASGLQPLYACRSGSCGTCATRVAKGTVDYGEPPAHDVAPGEALICIGHPHPGLHLEDGTLNREGVTLDL